MELIYIGDIIRQRRLELGLTQEELCAGICESTSLSRIETGKQVPTYLILNALLSRLGLPAEKYYAMVGKNELEMERLKDEIVDCNARGLGREGLEKLERLAALTTPEDRITAQFILRSRVLLGRLEEDGTVVPYSTEEKLEILFRAMELTVSGFDLDEIGRRRYTKDEMKIINQIGVVYGDSGQRRQALDIYYQLFRYIRKRLVENANNAAEISLVAYNYAYYLCMEKRYEEAQEMAEWGWEHSLRWNKAAEIGGFMWVLAESYYHMGKIEESKAYFYQSYYAQRMMKDDRRADVVKNYLLEYYHDIPGIF